MLYLKYIFFLNRCEGFEGAFDPAIPPYFLSKVRCLEIVLILVKGINLIRVTARTLFGFNLASAS